MMNDELVWALRHCTDETVKVCPPCPYFAWDKQKDNEGCMGEMMRDAADAIEELISRVPKWISVKDELPNDSRTVIIYSRSRIVGCGFYMGSRNNWLHLTTASGGVLADDVTHWMELPQSPKGVYPEWRTMCFNRRYNDDV